MTWHRSGMFSWYACKRCESQCYRVRCEVCGEDRMVCTHCHDEYTCEECREWRFLFVRRHVAERAERFLFGRRSDGYAKSELHSL